MTTPLNLPNVIHLTDHRELTDVSVLAPRHPWLFSVTFDTRGSVTAYVGTEAQLADLAADLDRALTQARELRLTAQQKEAPTS